MVSCSTMWRSLKCMAWQLGLDARKSVFGGLRTTNAQTSLRIRAVCSAPLLFAHWKVSYLDLLRAKFLFSRVYVAEQASLNLTFSETPKTGFLATRLNWWIWKNQCPIVPHSDLVRVQTFCKFDKQVDTITVTFQAKILTSLCEHAQRCPAPHLFGGSFKLVISPWNGPFLVSVVNQKSFSIQRLLGSNILSIFMNAFFVYLDANELGARQPFLGKWDPKIECRDVQQS